MSNARATAVFLMILIAVAAAVWVAWRTSDPDMPRIVTSTPTHWPVAVR